MVIMYSNDGCQPCKATERLLKKIGMEPDVDYTVIKVKGNEAAGEAVKALGYMQTPVVVTPEGHWGGFNPDRIKALKISAV